MIQTLNRQQIFLMAAKSILLFSFFAIATSYAAAAENRSVKLTGSDYDYMSISDAEQLNLDIAGDMTMAMWIKPDNIDDNMPLISKWNRGDKTQYILFLETGELGLHLNDEPSGFGYSTFRVAHGKSAGEWFHVAMVYKAASGTTEFFVDGQSIGIDSSAPNSIANTDAAFSIGGREDQVTAFKGNIDDVRIWSRALPANKITNLYSNPTGFKNGADLQGFWKFNGNLRDQSVNKNNLNFSFSSDVPY